MYLRLLNFDKYGLVSSCASFGGRRPTIINFTSDFGVCIIIIVAAAITVAAGAWSGWAAEAWLDLPVAASQVHQYLHHLDVLG